MSSFFPDLNWPESILLTLPECFYRSDLSFSFGFIWPDLTRIWPNCIQNLPKSKSTWPHSIPSLRDLVPTWTDAIPACLTQFQPDLFHFQGHPHFRPNDPIQCQPKTDPIPTSDLILTSSDPVPSLTLFQSYLRTPNSNFPWPSSNFTWLFYAERDLVWHENYLTWCNSILPVPASIPTLTGQIPTSHDLVFALISSPDSNPVQFDFLFKANPL